MPRIMVIDTYYDAFIRSMPFDPSSTYEAELRKVLDRSFGTADFVSRNLKQLGWDAVDVIANHEPLQMMWARESEYWNGYAFYVLGAQIEDSDPDVVFLQDLSLMASGPIGVTHLIGDRILAGQLSCPWPGDDIVKRFDILYTSFPHYVPRIEALNVRAVYNPLACEPSVLERCHADDEMDFGRKYDVVFIGGVGNPSHWKYGMEVLETVAREIPTFKWWGYGYETLPADSALRHCYQGEAWGLDMYEILLQSKICLNRHGEVAEGYANNMRMFEATGCGAMLLTEMAPNIEDFFKVRNDFEIMVYKSAEDCARQIKFYLKNWDIAEMSARAARAQARTIRDHTYAERMKTVSETLLSMLCPA